MKLLIVRDDIEAVYDVKVSFGSPDNANAIDKLIVNVSSVRHSKSQLSTTNVGATLFKCIRNRGKL